MMLIEETTVPDGALPVEQFKAHLRLGSGFDQDSVQDVVLTSFLRAAVAAIEARTGKALFERAFSLTVSDWATPDAQALPVAPVSALTGVTLMDRSGAATAASNDAFWLERDVHRPRVRAVGVCLPDVPTAGTVSVAFTAGFGAVWADVPADLAQAVMLLAAHYYDCLLYTSPSPRDKRQSRMPSSA